MKCFQARRRRAVEWKWRWRYSTAGRPGQEQQTRSAATCICFSEVAPDRTLPMFYRRRQSRRNQVKCDWTSTTELQIAESRSRRAGVRAEKRRRWCKTVRGRYTRALRFRSAGRTVAIDATLRALVGLDSSCATPG